jgi:hypothetical protein
MGGDGNGAAPVLNLARRGRGEGGSVGCHTTSGEGVGLARGRHPDRTVEAAVARQRRARVRERRGRNGATTIDGRALTTAVTADTWALTIVTGGCVNPI